MQNRRMFLGLAGLGVPALGAIAYAGQTGRIDLFKPLLPEDGDLPGLPGVRWNEAPVAGLSRAAFNGGVTLLNVWASWCPDCRLEHPLLLRLSRIEGIRLYGLAADDSEANAARYLNEHGNPFSRVSVEQGRRYQRALKHRGIPQTYVFDAGGNFLDKISGALTEDALRGNVIARLETGRLPA